VQAIFQHDGTVDKFVGDAILAVFGSPESDPQHYEKAIYAAIAMQDAMRRVNDRRRANGEVVCEIGIGIHCGEVLHGFIGAAERLEFTVIGDVVNKTSRYCDQAPAGQILISPQVFEHVFRAVQTEPVTITTKHEGELKAYRVMGRKMQP
jgi:adenylate cyclase